jgi:hypothetical protein
MEIACHPPAQVAFRLLFVEVRCNHKMIYYFALVKVNRRTAERAFQKLSVRRYVVLSRALRAYNFILC